MSSAVPDDIAAERGALGYAPRLPSRCSYWANGARSGDSTEAVHRRSGPPAPRSRSARATTIHAPSMTNARSRASSAECHAKPVSLLVVEVDPREYRRGRSAAMQGSKSLRRSAHALLRCTMSTSRTPSENMIRTARVLDRFDGLKPSALSCRNNRVPSVAIDCGRGRGLRCVPRARLTADLPTSTDEELVSRRIVSSGSPSEVNLPSHGVNLLDAHHRPVAIGPATRTATDAPPRVPGVGQQRPPAASSSAALRSARRSMTGMTLPPPAHCEVLTDAMRRRKLTPRGQADRGRRPRASCGATPPAGESAAPYVGCLAKARHSVDVLTPSTDRSGREVWWTPSS
jgi:hypothetical protein